MVRKRDRYTRARAKRSRPKTPAPKSGWLLSELAELSATPIRTLRYYVEQRILHPSEFRGTATRYQRRELLRLFTILRVRIETRLSLAEIRKRLDTLTESELEAWLRKRPLPPGLATVLATSSISASAHTQTAAVQATEIAGEAPGPFTGALIESWQRIPLAAGLDLMVRTDASPAVRSAAHRICANYLSHPQQEARWEHAASASSRGVRTAG